MDFENTFRCMQKRRSQESRPCARSRAGTPNGKALFYFGASSRVTFLAALISGVFLRMNGMG